jgi:DNA-binding transcriptional LysR family regulator
MILSMPERIANDFVDLAPLNIVPIPIELPAYDLVMVWHPLRDTDPAHRWLRDQITGICGELDTPFAGRSAAR